MSSPFAETGRLARLYLRQDRIRIPVWVLSIAVLTWATAEAFTGLYPEAEERQVLAETMRNPAMTAMVGQGYGLDDYTFGAMMAHQMLLFTAVAAAIMGILLIARHTRAEEEDGRTETLRALPVGRLSNLSAAFLAVTATHVILALLSGLGLYALGIESMDLEGSLLYGAVLGATGIFFTALTAFFAQLTESSRGTIGLSFAVLLLSYLLRAAGDVGNEILSWLTPFGWALGTETYVNNYWWPLLVLLGASIIFLLLSISLNARRDLGSGLLPARAGRKNASRFLQSPFGLTVRLQRTSLIAWAAGMFTLGLSYGSVLGDVEAFAEDLEMMSQMLPQAADYTLLDQFISLLMVVTSMICTIPVLLAVLKLKGEEKKDRVELLLSRAVSRTRLLGSAVLYAVIVSVIMQVLSVSGLYLAGNAVVAGGMNLAELLGYAAVYLPAMWVMMGAAVLLLGVIPKWTGAAYLYLTYSFLVVYMGGLLGFPAWMNTTTPFGHVPQVPVEALDYLPVMLLLLTAVLLCALGFIGYSRRNMT